MFIWGIFFLIFVSPFILTIFIAYRAWKVLRSWYKFFLALFVSFAGIVFPVWVFLMGSFVLPEWKGAGGHGFLDCFAIGKLVLLPLVLWACTAFYRIVIIKTGADKRWVTFGILTGAVISNLCLIMGLLYPGADSEFGWWLLVPLYVAIWYVWVGAKQVYRANLDATAYLRLFVYTIPAWIASMITSIIYYSTLSASPPCGDCFIVTAAMRGHTALVGPFVDIPDGHSCRKANRQLLCRVLPFLCCLKNGQLYK